MGKSFVVLVSAVSGARGPGWGGCGGAGGLMGPELRPAFGRRRVRAAARGLGTGPRASRRRRLDDLRLGRAVRDRGGAVADRRGGRCPLQAAATWRWRMAVRLSGRPRARSRRPRCSGWSPGVSSPPCRTARVCGSTSTVRSRPMGRCRSPRCRARAPRPAQGGRDREFRRPARGLHRRAGGPVDRPGRGPRCEASGLLARRLRHRRAPPGRCRTGPGRGCSSRKTPGPCRRARLSPPSPSPDRLMTDRRCSRGAPTLGMLAKWSLVEAPEDGGGRG